MVTMVFARSRSTWLANESCARCSARRRGDRCSRSQRTEQVLREVGLLVEQPPPPRRRRSRRPSSARRPQRERIVPVDLDPGAILFEQRRAQTPFVLHEADVVAAAIAQPGVGERVVFGTLIVRRSASPRSSTCIRQPTAHCVHEVVCGDCSTAANGTDRSSRSARRPGTARLTLPVKSETYGLPVAVAMITCAPVVGAQRLLARDDVVEAHAALADDAALLIEHDRRAEVDALAWHFRLEHARGALAHAIA